MIHVVVFVFAWICNLTRYETEQKTRPTAKAQLHLSCPSYSRTPVLDGVNNVKPSDIPDHLAQPYELEIVAASSGGVQTISSDHVLIILSGANATCSNYVINLHQLVCI